MAMASIQVVRPGLLTTVQDGGRWGHQAEGVPVAGPMDWFSHRLANQLVGNGVDAATLEITLVGPELIVDADTVIAITGADFPVTCDAVPVAVSEAFVVSRGSRLCFGRRGAGARAYLAVAGGIVTTPVLGSRSTHLLTRMGGHEGRALLAGDVLRLEDVPLSATSVRRAIGLPMPAASRGCLRVTPGPQVEWFTADAWATLIGHEFRVSSRSNRMGYRLEGAMLPRLRRDELITQPLAEGAIQVPVAGEPILLLADRQTAGGYPQIAAVIAADLPVAGQLAPGDVVTFTACSRAEAANALILRERQLLRYAPSRDLA